MLDLYDFDLNSRPGARATFAWARNCRLSLKIDKGSTMFAARSQIGLMSKRFTSKTLMLVICLCLWGSQGIAVENPQAVVQTGTDQIHKILTQYPQDVRARRE
jgi:hypothetical protein